MLSLWVLECSVMNLCGVYLGQMFLAVVWFSLSPFGTRVVSFLPFDKWMLMYAQICLRLDLLKRWVRNTVHLVLCSLRGYSPLIL